MTTPAIIGAFLMEGLHDAGYNAVLAKARDLGYGPIELIAELTLRVPVLQRLYDLAETHPGVFHYEVTVPFGHWYGEQVRKGEVPELVHGKLFRLASEFYEQGNKVTANQIEEALK